MLCWVSARTPAITGGTRPQVCFDHNFTDAKSGPMFALSYPVDVFIPKLNNTQDLGKPPGRQASESSQCVVFGEEWPHDLISPAARHHRGLTVMQVLAVREEAAGGGHALELL
ncbi:hypothetical protein O3P69_015819 [Scylla paramamosain]|uniref:Uncharacterized protein n=1 Tax=Scylla paramamosain TaxID=85552 RepID=A0AAW0TB36_SCYPA